MSLITQVLNDLDKREAEAGEKPPLYADLRRPGRNRWADTRLLALGGVGLITVAMVGTLAWHRNHVIVAPVQATHVASVVPQSKPKAPAAHTPSPAPQGNPAPSAAAVPERAQLAVASASAPFVAAAPIAAASPAPAPATASAPAVTAPAPAPAPAQVAAVALPESRPVEPAKDARANSVQPTTVSVTPAAQREKTGGNEAASSHKKREKVRDDAPAMQVAKAEARSGKGDGSALQPGGHEKQAIHMVEETPANFKTMNASQRSANAYRTAVSLLQQSRTPEAQQALRQSIADDPSNRDARLLLAGLWVDAGRGLEAASVLQDGLRITPGDSNLCVALARLQLAGGNNELALATLQQGMSNAGDDGDYHAFVAAVLQKLGHHEEAIQHYLVALRGDGSMPRWLIGIGVSLQAAGKFDDAREAYQRALDTGELSPEVAQFADQQIKRIASAAR